MSTNLTIVTGPDLSRIVSRLVDGDNFGGSNDRQRPVLFKVTDGKQGWEEHIFLQSLEREDGSGKNWNMTGRNSANGAQVKIFYTLHNRTGAMEFLKPLVLRS